MRSIKSKSGNVIASLIGSAIWALLAWATSRISLEADSWWIKAGLYAVYLLSFPLIIATAVHFLARRGQLSIYPPVSIRWRVSEKRIVYRIDEEGVLHFSRITTAKAQENNIDRFVDKFVWTGGGCSLPLPGGDAERNVTLAHAGIWTIYESIINRSLRKGESAKIENTWPPLTNWRESSPFVSTSADEPTGKIIFEVQIPERFRSSSQVIVEELRSIDSILPFRTECLEFKNSIFTWEVDPVLFRHYRVRWAWKGDSDSPTILALTEG